MPPNLPADGDGTRNAAGADAVGAVDSAVVAADGVGVRWR